MNRENYIPREKRKTLLFLADDMRIPSGIGTMTKEIIEGTCHYYNWVHVGAAISHPESGKVIDISQELSKNTGVEDASTLIYPNHGYGDPLFLRKIIKQHSPDAILHFTDPRYWIWLYEMEHEIRQKIPLFFYSIWDSPPAPMYNRDYYRSVDWFGCISKQTYNLIKQVRKDKDPLEPWQISYIPHGINPTKFFKVDENNESLIELKNRIFGENKYEFVVYYNSRNIRRKQVSDIILAFDNFVSKLSPEKKKKVALLLHTHPVDENGTDLPRVISDVTPNVKDQIYFYSNILGQDELNLLYNCGDITINISSNEGFGLSVAESLMTEHPVIVNVTGGLQDQCGFVDEAGNYLDPAIHYNSEWMSNHDGKYKNCGKWAYPIFPSNRSIQGSPITPYIFDDRCKWEDVSHAMMYWFTMTKKERQECGLAGREFCLGDGGLNSENMCNLFIKHMDIALENFIPKTPFTLEKV